MVKMHRRLLLGWENTTGDIEILPSLASDKNIQNKIAYFRTLKPLSLQESDNKHWFQDQQAEFC